MINNNNNTVDFNLNRGDVAETLRHQMVTSNNPTTMQTAMAQQKNSIFWSICSNDPNQKHKGSNIIISEKLTPNTKDKKSFEIMVNTKERVKVQHLETPSILQNNRWNFDTFCRINDSGKEKMPNNNNNNITINQNDSAFKDIRSNVEETERVASKDGNSNLERLNNVLDYQQYANSTKETDKRISPVCRTKDQENAFRRIEDVHNYSKLNRYSYSNGSSNSSLHEDDDVEEDEECDDDDDEVDDDVVDESFETYSYFDKKPQRSINVRSNDLCFSNNNNNTNRNLRTRDRTELVSNQNIAMQHGEGDDVSNMPIRPDHHARRPMNAFLIFCKRHRAIVKDRYKSFENRAITKILGDWWASLDANEKKCYTSLAQQNKDAFFNANPNFKWYKLPAPPLRTLNTRPSNTDKLMDQDDPVLDPIPHHTHHTEDHIFKLADEAQMGDLSTLMIDKKLNNQNALQQALGETTQYLSIQIPDIDSPTNKWASLDVKFRRKLQNDNSFSSNSSEEDLLPKKTSRSCKGKIYQELVNSGQIAAITKKPKLPKLSLQQTSEQGAHFGPDAALPSQVESSLVSECCDWRRDSTTQINCSDTLTKCADKSKPMECNSSQTYDLIQFDLEEKIKELPALNLDTYLQRKRNIKKKKKINSKKRNTSSSSKSPCADITIPEAVTLSPPINPPKDISLTNQAVGSRKRKARKESITRRDISAIENEVASLLPLQEDFSTIRCNDRYYYNDGQFAATNDSLSRLNPACSNACAMEGSPTVDQFSNFLTNINQNISSTSDLLILAEVAAKRTEISN